ncbi:lichenicidin alpha family lanthipeptide [Streptococcus sp. H31]|uniref:lichenicidin alpha family lanthipeptide n=1 Tax=Streptococcus huangxiaojuni TaxID=3237239 RepID=UPI0034A34393
MKSLKNAGLQTELFQLVESSEKLESYTAGKLKGTNGLGSWALGNKGWLCTVTRECINNCR